MFESFCSLHQVSKDIPKLCCIYFMFNVCQLFFSISHRVSLRLFLRWTLEHYLRSYCLIRITEKRVLHKHQQTSHWKISPQQVPHSSGFCLELELLWRCLLWCLCDPYMCICECSRACAPEKPSPRVETECDGILIPSIMGYAEIHS